MPAHRGQQKGGLGPFAQQLAMFSLASIITDLASNVIGSLLPGLSGGQRGSGQFITGQLANDRVTQSSTTLHVLLDPAT